MDATSSWRADGSIDRVELLKRCNNNEQFLRQMLVKFVNVFESELHDSVEALQRHDLKRVGTIAHRMKGSAFNMAARRLSETAWGLKNAAKAGDQEFANDLLNSLNVEWKTVRNHIDETLQKSE